MVLSMIEYIDGNLLEANTEALVNTVNTVGVMGKGIALQFKRAFPDNFRQYEQACRKNEVQIGQMFTVSVGNLLNSSPRYIINFPTKRHWKGKSRIEDIQHGLQSLIAEIKRLRIQSIAIPPLGCGNGGLEWSQVKPLIEEAFAEMPADIRVLIFEPQGAPEAKAMPITTQKPKMTRGRALLIQLLDSYLVPGYEASALEIQKLAYFLQEAGEELKLHFVKHKYGPYADNLRHVLNAVEGHYIQGYGDGTAPAEITLLPNAVETAHEFLKEPEVAQRLSNVSNLIEGFETPYSLELLATVHWIATKEDQKAKTDLDAAIEGLRNWNERKSKVFQPEHIHIAWQHLRDKGWLTPDEPTPQEAESVL
jgi:O-acetyl-ADP-ribose deacetylase (regulator of RNase III)